jgi:hypothetical protein
MKKILLFLLLPLFVNSQTIMMNPECYSIDVVVDSLTKNYHTSNAVVTPLGVYNDLISVDIDTLGSSFTVNFMEQSMKYMVLSTYKDTINGGTTYYIQNPWTSNYGIVYVDGDTYIVIVQKPNSFNKLNGILCKKNVTN